MKAQALICLLAAACASDARRFPLRAPLWRDTDLDSRSVPCHGKPDKRVCRPAEYVSSLLWDAADNLVFGPIVKFFAVAPGAEAVNVNSFDEVPDSSWFTNRIGRAPMTPDDVARGSCGDEVLDSNDPDGSWLIDMGKPNGANPGFRIRLADGRKYMLKSDLPAQPERTTAAAAVAGRLYHAAGWWVSCDTPVYVRRSLLRLKPGLVTTDNQNRPHPFDEAALDKLMGEASKRGDRTRFVASRWLPGRVLGPFTYGGIRDDDPGDIIPHEDRRDLRGAKLLAAWTSHFDSREQNSMNVWLAADPNAPDSSPGQVRHYYIDLGDCFGSLWDDPIWRRIGYAYYFDFGYLVEDFLTFGLISRPWDRARLATGGAAIFGYFGTRDFVPEEWHGGYPNPAFGRMTEHDGAWAARIIARFEDAHLAAAVKVGELTDPAASDYLYEHLRGRRDAILRRFLSRLSPVTDLTVEGDELCGVDLARRTRVFGAVRFHYRAQVRGGAPVPVRALDDGRLCATLPRVAGAGGADGDGSRYAILELWNGHAPNALVVHLYDLGAGRGFRIAGIER